MAGAQAEHVDRKNYDPLAYRYEALREHTIRSFFLSKYEITNQQYVAFCKKVKCSPPDDPQLPGLHDYINNFPNHPVVNISWLENKLN